MNSVALDAGIQSYKERTGLSIKEIGARAGVSRSTIHRLRHGKVMEKEVLVRLAELVGVPVSTILSGAIENIGNMESYFIRVQQIEQLSRRTFHIADPLFYLTTSNDYDNFLCAAMANLVEQSPPPYQAVIRGLAESVLEGLKKRKAAFRTRGTPATHIIVRHRLEKLLAFGVGGLIELPADLRREGRQIAATEAERIAQYMETEPTKVEHGLVDAPCLTISFDWFEGKDRSFLVLNPFLADINPLTAMNIATITTDGATASEYRHIGEAAWKQASTGAAGAAQIRKLLEKHSRVPVD